MKRRNFLVSLAILVIVVVGGTYGFIAWRNRSSRLALDRELAGARAEGIPLNPADLEGSERVPDDRNAATIYFKVVPQINRALAARSSYSLASYKFIAGRTLSPSELEDINTGLESVASHLSQLSQAARLPDCDLRLPLRETSFLFQMMDTIRVFIARARSRMDAGNLKGAYEDLKTVGLMCAHLGTAHGILAFALPGPLEGMAAGLLDKLLPASKGDRKLLAEARDVLSAMPRRFD